MIGRRVHTPELIDSVPLGRMSTGESIDWELSDPSNLAIQGMSRSGKSAATYSFIARLAALAPRVKIHMIDISGVLAAPLIGHPAAGMICTGADSPEDAVRLIEALLERMRDRVVQLLDERRDKLTTWTDTRPLELLILEETPGLVEMLSDDDTKNGRKAGEKLAPRFTAALRQILAQGLKSGVVTLVIAQRLDTSVISGPARSNLGTRICLRMDDRDGVAMLFPGSSAELVDKLAVVSPGRGVITHHGMRAQSVAMDWLTYQDYLHHLDTSGGELLEGAAL